jgi:hypothetical protein
MPKSNTNGRAPVRKRFSIFLSESRAPRPSLASQRRHDLDSPERLRGLTVTPPKSTGNGRGTSHTRHTSLRYQSGKVKGRRSTSTVRCRLVRMGRPLSSDAAAF